LNILRDDGRTGKFGAGGGNDTHGTKREVEERRPTKLQNLVMEENEDCPRPDGGWGGGEKKKRGNQEKAQEKETTKGGLWTWADHKMKRTDHDSEGKGLIHAV